jgi:hypothetical protein
MEQIRIRAELSTNVTERLIDFFQSLQSFKIHLRVWLYEELYLTTKVEFI